MAFGSFFSSWKEVEQIAWIKVTKLPLWQRHAEVPQFFSILTDFDGTKCLKGMVRWLIVFSCFFHVFPGIVIKPFGERANCCNFINALGWKCVKINGKMWGQSRRASTSKCFVFCCPSERLLQIRNPKRLYDKYLNLFKVMFHFVPTVTHHQSTSLGEYVLLFFRHQTSKSKNMAVECQGHLLGDGSVHHGWDPCLMNDWHLINDAS